MFINNDDCCEPSPCFQSLCVCGFCTFLPPSLLPLLPLFLLSPLFTCFYHCSRDRSLRHHDRFFYPRLPSFSCRIQCPPFHARRLHHGIRLDKRLTLVLVNIRHPISSTDQVPGDMKTTCHPLLCVNHLFTPLKLFPSHTCISFFFLPTSLHYLYLTCGSRLPSSFLSFLYLFFNS